MAQAKLDVKVTGDASGALKAIQAVRAAGNEAATKFREQSKEAIGGLVRLVNPITLLTTAIIAGVAKIGAKIREHFEEGEEKVKKAGEALRAASKDVGVTADAYQAVRTQAQLAGKSVDEFNAAMERVKSGKETIDEVAQSFGRISMTAASAKDSIKQISLEVAAARKAREAAAKEAKENFSAVTDDDRLEAWARVLIAQGKNWATVREGVLMTNRNRRALNRMSYREQTEMLDRLKSYYDENNHEAQARRAEEARLKREREANEAAWKRTEREALERSRAITAAGGVENWAVGQVSAEAGQLVDADDHRVRELVSRYGGWYNRTRTRFMSPQELAREYAEKQKEIVETERRKDEERRRADEKRQKEEDARRAREETHRERISDVKTWAREAIKEARGSYSGGYSNNFGLAFGGGDIIGSGRFRAVTRMTEAAKQLQVSEKIYEITKQMNEKLKALEE